MLDESIYHFRGGGGSSLFYCFFLFWWKILLENNVDRNQIPHYVASDLGLHCLSMTILQVSKLEWVNGLSICEKRMHGPT